MNRAFLLTLITIVVVIVSGCGNNAPELKQISSQINFSKSPDSDTVSSELVVFVSADDEDGEDDIESLHVINEKKQFFWSVDSDSWSSRNSRGMEWIGYEKLLTVDGSLPDPGEYRILVTDRAGERVENSIFIPLINEIPEVEDFPILIFTEDNKFVEAKSQEKHNILSFYNNKGELLGAFRVTPGRVDINKLKDGASILENYRSAEISYYSDKFGTGLVSGPFIRN